MARAIYPDYFLLLREVVPTTTNLSVRSVVWTVVLTEAHLQIASGGQQVAVLDTGPKLLALECLALVSPQLQPNHSTYIVEEHVRSRRILGRQPTSFP